ncbi:hypothetical protein H6P81_010717 [Aristolochia fimbriata]|uniref:Uncharacterized protein n=1 Tax=Aristolochia fimbriata TaxID=158543 RepID=A0AAV7ESW9_ARIFI|nr:hypothetical protein H6P81_010717 [Aristolochia fimbriata]
MEREEGNKVPLLGDSVAEAEEEEDLRLLRRVAMESKKLWRIVGPAILTRIAMTFGRAGTRLFSIANNVVVGFNFGFLLGMARALENLCGQAFGAKKYDILGVYMQRSWIVLLSVVVLLLPMYFFATLILKLIGQPDDIAEQAGVVSVWLLPLHFSFVRLFPSRDSPMSNEEPCYCLRLCHLACHQCLPELVVFAELSYGSFCGIALP